VENEVVLVLPHPDVPLRLAAPDDLDAPHGSVGRVLDRQCPGRGTSKSCTNSAFGFGPWANRRRELQSPTSSQGRQTVRPARCQGPLYRLVRRSPSRVGFPVAEAKGTAYEHRHRGGEGLGGPPCVGSSLMTGTSRPSPRFLHNVSTISLRCGRSLPRFRSLHDDDVQRLESFGYRWVGLA
jgi:hypothetical protein